MCGICLLIRQKMASAARARESGVKAQAASSTSSSLSRTLVPSAPQSTSSALAVDDRLDAQSYALVPSSAGAVSLTPCACAVAGLEMRNFLCSTDAADDLFTEMLHNLRRRGPDTYGVTRRSFVTSCRAPADRGVSLLLQMTPRPDTHTDDVMTLRTEVAGVASVLGLRGHSTVAQPYDVNVAADAEGDRQASSWDYRSSLLWNGEIFGGALCPPPWGSDTVLLATRLSQMELECVRLTAADAAACMADGSDGSGSVGTDEKEGEKGNNEAEEQRHSPALLLPLVERQRIFLRRCTTLFEQQVEGPYSFIFIATRLRLAVFGRDPLGRHSLLSHVRVTQPVTGAGAAADELDVELIVSSVGVHHHYQQQQQQVGLCSCSEEGAEATRQRESGAVATQTRPPAATAAPLLSSSSALATARDVEDTPSAADAVAVVRNGHASTAKRPRHEKRHTAVAATGAAANLRGVTLTKAAAVMADAAALATAATVAAEEDGEEAGGGVEDAEGQEEVCWQEVSVTGLFAVPLQAPLVYCDRGSAASVTDQLHPVCASSRVNVVVSGDKSAASVRGAHVLLLHCPWQRTHHLVHPLLRTATLPMVPHELPPFELILAHEEIAVLPEPLLRWAGHLMKSMQPDGGLEQSWVDWAAAHYMLALAVSMHRRITVANSGAADGRDAQELSTARRRPLCILFSGGIDCTVIAALAHYLLPVETPIELVNVAFGKNPEEAPDRVAAFRSMEELLRLPLLSSSRSSAAVADGAAATTMQEREWRLVLVDVPSKTTVDSTHIKDLLVPRHTIMDLDIGTALWYAARASGRMQVLKHSDVDGAAEANVGGDSFDGTPPTTAVGSPTTATSLMQRTSNSGGSPTVTLEGFSKHFRAYTGATAASAAVAPWESGAGTADTPFLGVSPPRSPGQQASPASAASPEEAANTQKYQILVDVLVKEGRSGGGPLTPVLLSTLGKEYSLFLQPHIKRYGYKKLGSFLNDAAKAGYIKFAPDAPSKAVRLCRPADMERAAAVPPSPWFTTAYMKAQAPSNDAGGVTLPCPGTFTSAYTSHAKVVLLGMGADETLGGYTRYRRFFQREGMAGAQRELERDFARLWQRNLGRDDRVTMDSGREPRFPFLDEGVLRTLEWIVLKRRNNILATQDHLRGGRTAGGSHGGVTDLPSSPASSSSTAATASAGAAVSPPASSDELLRLALEPIVSFRLPAGEGDKRVLRRVASVLGLSDVTHLQKRAIQFGSRIAERKIKGTTDF